MKRQPHEINNDLLQSIWQQNPSRVKELIEEGADVMANVNGSVIPIFAALQNSNSAMGIEISKTILENTKFDATIKDMGGQTLLVTFISSIGEATLTEDKTFIIKKLLSAGADIDGTQHNSTLITCYFNKKYGAL